MKTQIELIEIYTKNFTKCVESHGADSDYTLLAFFQLRAAKIGIPFNEMFDWAQKEFDRQHQLAIEAA